MKERGLCYAALLASAEVSNTQLYATTPASRAPHPPTGIATLRAYNIMVDGVNATSQKSLSNNTGNDGGEAPPGVESMDMAFQQWSTMCMQRHVRKIKAAHMHATNTSLRAVGSKRQITLLRATNLGNARCIGEGDVVAKRVIPNKVYCML